MKKMFFSLFFCAFFNANFNLLAFEVEIKTPELYRGTAGWIKVTNLKTDKNLSATFNNKEKIFFYFNDKLNAHIGIFAVDVMLEPGDYSISVLNKKEKFSFTVKVLDKQYGVRNITVAPSQVELSEENLKRTKEERKKVVEALNTKSPLKLWPKAFINPVEAKVNSSFGRQTKFNGVLNARPHSGADFSVGTGTKVKAPADGTVILTANHFFAGNSVYIDHGQGLIGMFFHLSEIKVNEGEAIKQGDVIGLSGATGRVSGAHLHYGLYLNTARLDPIEFHKLSMELE